MQDGLNEYPARAYEVSSRREHLERISRLSPEQWLKSKPESGLDNFCWISCGFLPRRAHLVLELHLEYNLFRACRMLSMRIPVTIALRIPVKIALRIPVRIALRIPVRIEDTSREVYSRCPAKR